MKLYATIADYQTDVRIKEEGSRGSSLRLMIVAMNSTCTNPLLGGIW